MVDIKGGYAGKLLRCNLSDKKITSESIDEQACRLYLGGRGLAIYYLYKELKRGVNPLGDHNKIVFSIGPLTGSEVPSCSRYCVASKSPLTDFSLHSFGGGFWPAELKWAGYDMIIVEGAAETPSYLYISDDQTEIRDARKLWGFSTFKTEKSIKHELRDENLKIASIGPAGERMVKIAGVVSDVTSKRSGSASRGGGGAVMGSKQLKAIVVKAEKQIQVAHPDLLKTSIQQINSCLAEKEAIRGLRKRGTSRGIHIFNEAFGILPTRNFQTGFFKDIEGISPEKFEEHVVKHIACYRCSIACSKIREIKSGPYKGIKQDGPEYETIALLGSNCGNSNADNVLAADYLCDMYGIDTISAGACISFLMELYQRGLITQEQADHLDLSWGNTDTILTLIEKIGLKDGIGEVLADGVKAASEKLGYSTQYFAMHSKGLEMPGYDPRGAQGHGLNIGTTNRGACHERGYCTQELFGFPEEPPSDRLSTEGKGRLIKNNQDRNTIFDSTITCFFASFQCPKQYTAALNSITGITEFGELSQLMIIGERIWNLERAFNIREGLTKKDDTLPERFRKEPMPSGASTGSISHWEELLEEYYQARGYNQDTGYPQKNLLKKLNLDFVISDLARLDNTFD